MRDAADRLLRQFLTAWRLPRWRWALLVALLSDAVAFGLVLLPPVQWLADVVTAAVLLVVLGIRWPLLAALAVEVVPALELFPAWTFVVLAMATTESRKPTRDPGDVGRDVRPAQSPPRIESPE